MISCIELNQFKRHTHAAFEFDSGLTGISGENAAGKTTVLKAILFALFGASAAGTKEHIPTRGGSGDTEVSVSLTIPIHGEVLVKRTLKGAKVWSKDGTLLANGVTPTIKLIEEAYGMASQDLQLLMYSKQGESQALLALGAAALQKTVERLAKTDLVDKVLGLIGTDLSRIDGELQGLGADTDIVALERNLITAKADFTAQQANMADVRESVAKAVAAETDLRDRYQKANEDALKRSRLQASVDAQSAHIKSLNEAVEKASLALASFDPKLDASLEEKKETRDQLYTDYQGLSGRITAAATTKAELQQWSAAVEKAEAEVKQSLTVSGQIDELEHSLGKLKEQDKALSLKVNTAKHMLDQARKAVDDGVCRECKRPFSAEEQEAAIRRQEEAADAYDVVYQVWAELQTSLHTAEGELATLRLAFHPGCAERLAQAGEAVLRLRPTLDVLLGDFESIEQMQVSVQVFTKQIRDLDILIAQLSSSVRDRQVAERSLIGSRELLHEADQKISDLTMELLACLPGEDVADLSSKLRSASDHLSGLRTLERKISEALMVASHQATRYQEAYDTAKEQGVRKAQLEMDQSQRKRLQTWLRKSRSDLMSEMWDGLLNYASHLINTTTNGQLSKVFRTDGELMVEEESETVAVSELSGYQRSLVGLALRIAMSRVFYGGDLPLFLDEPTADASNENAARIAGMLQGLGSQVIFVSHRDGDSANAATILRI
jgi:DNA repair exonuclease SbcCD ATPase subunit